MKRIKIASMIMFFVMLFIQTSCVVVGKDHGKRGWQKNSNNPHHINSTNPGMGNKK